MDHAVKPVTMEDRSFMSMKDAQQIVLYATKVSGLIMVEVNAGMLKLIHKSNELGAPIIRGEVASTPDAEGPLDPYDKFARAVQRIIDPKALDKSGFCVPYWKPREYLTKAITYKYRSAIAAEKELPKTQKMVLALGRVRRKATAARAVQFDNGLECVGFVSYRDMVVRDADDFFLDVRLSDQSEQLRGMLQDRFHVTELSVVCTSESTEALRWGASVMELQILYVLIKEFKRKCSAVYTSFPASNTKLQTILDKLGFIDITDEVETAQLLDDFVAMVLLPTDDRIESLAGDYAVLNRMLQPVLDGIALTMKDHEFDAQDIRFVCPLRNRNGVRKCV